MSIKHFLIQLLRNNLLRIFKLTETEPIYFVWFLLFVVLIILWWLNILTNIYIVFSSIFCILVILTSILYHKRHTNDKTELHWTFTVNFIVFLITILFGIEVNRYLTNKQQEKQKANDINKYTSLLMGEISFNYNQLILKDFPPFVLPYRGSNVFIYLKYPQSLIFNEASKTTLFPSNILYLINDISRYIKQHNNLMDLVANTHLNRNYLNNADDVFTTFQHLNITEFYLTNQLFILSKALHTFNQQNGNK